MRNVESREGNFKEIKNLTAFPDIQRRSLVIQHSASHLISECNLSELHSNVEVTVKIPGVPV